MQAIKFSKNYIVYPLVSSIEYVPHSRQLMLIPPHYAQNETSNLEHDEWILAADTDHLGQTYDTPN